MAVGVCSSSRMRSSLRSISSRRRRIKEKLLSEVIGEGKCPSRVDGWGKLAERVYTSIIRPFRSALRVGPNAPLSLNPRPRTCSSAPKICLSKPTAARPVRLGSTWHHPPYQPDQRQQDEARTNSQKEQSNFSFHVPPQSASTLFEVIARFARFLSMPIEARVGTCGVFGTRQDGHPP
jgi:hypothetical protein